MISNFDRICPFTSEKDLFFSVERRDPAIRGSQERSAAPGHARTATRGRKGSGRTGAAGPRRSVRGPPRTSSRPQGQKRLRHVPPVRKAASALTCRSRTPAPLTCTCKRNTAVVQRQGSDSATPGWRGTVACASAHAFAGGPREVTVPVVAAASAWPGTRLPSAHRRTLLRTTGIAVGRWCARAGGADETPGRRRTRAGSGGVGHLADSEIAGQLSVARTAVHGFTVGQAAQAVPPAGGRLHAHRSRLSPSRQCRVSPGARRLSSPTCPGA